MTNCLSSSSFANLLFVNVQIGDVRATALFDTGAGTPERGGKIQAPADQAAHPRAQEDES